MKKLSWKLLLVVALIAVLIGCMVACNKTPNEPADTPVYDAPELTESDELYDEDVFFTELRNVARGIGNEKIEEGKNVYVEADLGLELGTKGTTTNSFKLGIALKAIIDRANDGKDTALSLDLTSGTKTILGVCYTATDKMAYVTLGDQKVKINTALVDLGSLIGGLFDAPIAGNTTVGGFVDKLTGDMKGTWTLDNLLDAILTQFSLKDGLMGMLNGSDAVSTLLKSILVNPANQISIEYALKNQALFRFFQASNDVENGKYTAVAAPGLTSMLKGVLKAGEKDGLDIKLSFGAKDHKLTDGVKVELELSPEGAAENPFAAISINHLRIKEAGKQAEYAVTAPKGEFKENLQLTIDEQIHIEGIHLAGGFATYVPTDLRLYATLNLDLGHEKIEENTTELYAMLHVTHLRRNDLMENFEIGSGIPVELSYTKGTLTLRTDSAVSILNVAGGALDLGYDMLLSGTVGNLFDSLLTGQAKADFDNTYWAELPDANGEGGKWNTGFQGVTIKGLGVKDIIDGIGGLLNKNSNAPATTSEEPSSNPTTEPTFSPNIYKIIQYVFTLLDTEGDGKFSIATSKGILATIGDILGYATGNQGTKETLVPTIAGWLDTTLGNLTNKMLKGSDLLIMPGIEGTTQEKIEEVFEELPDSLTFDFDFTKGLCWDLDIKLHSDPAVGLSWKSDIMLGEYTPVKDIRERLVDDKKAREKDVADAQAAIDAAQAKLDEAQAAYDKSSEKQALDNANTELTAAKSTFAGENNKNFNWIGELHKSYTDGSKISAAGINYFYNYLAAKVRNDQTAMTSALNSINSSLFMSGYFYKSGKTISDVQAKLDEMFDSYSTTVSPKQTAYDNAKTTSDNSDVYKAIAPANSELNAAKTYKTYVDGRLTYYTERYLSKAGKAELNAKKEELNFADVVQKEQAYQAGLKEITDYLAAEFEKVTDESKKETLQKSIDSYVKSIISYAGYWADGHGYQDSFKPEDKGGATLAAALYDAINGAPEAEDQAAAKAKEDYIKAFGDKLYSEGTLVQALCPLYKAAFTVSNSGSKATNNYSTTLTELQKLFVWCDINLTPAA